MGFSRSSFPFRPLSSGAFLTSREKASLFLLPPLALPGLKCYNIVIVKAAEQELPLLFNRAGYNGGNHPRLNGGINDFTERVTQATWNGQ